MAKFYTYDSREDIQKCLNCTKKECNNCLGHYYSAKDDVIAEDSESEV